MTLGKSFPFPILSEDSMDYIDGTKYSANISYKKGVSVSISHVITNGNLVSQLVSQNTAKFACQVSRPSSMFRKIFVHDGQDGNLAADQMIAPSDFYAPDILEGSIFRPIVVATQNINQAICPAHNLDGTCWREGEVIVPRGGIIAFDNWKEFKDNSSSSILKFEDSNKLSGGEISVRVSSEMGFRFIVSLSPDMIVAMRSAYFSNKGHVSSICTHALSRGFEILAKDYKDNWEEYPHLKILAAELDAKNIPLWDQDNFQPEKAATALEPHAFPLPVGENEDV